MERPKEFLAFPGQLLSHRWETQGVDQNQLFALALGLTEPWYVAPLDFSAEDKRLEIGIHFRRGGTFPYPECGAAGCKAYDTEQREWCL